MKQEDLDKSKLKPEHRMVLDWLCRNVARVYGFDEVAEALNVKRGIVEKAFGALKHQKYGALLPMHGPYGDALRPRHAWLPPDAEVRSLFPKLEHPPLPPKESRQAKALRPTGVRAAVAERDAEARLEILRRRKESKAKFRLAVAAENAGKRQDRIDAQAKAKALILEASTKAKAAASPSPATPKAVPSPAPPAAAKQQEKQKNV